MGFTNYLVFYELKRAPEHSISSDWCGERGNFNSAQFRSISRLSIIQTAKQTLFVHIPLYVTTHETIHAADWLLGKDKKVLKNMLHLSWRYPANHASCRGLCFQSCQHCFLFCLLFAAEYKAVSKVVQSFYSLLLHITSIILHSDQWLKSSDLCSSSAFCITDSCRVAQPITYKIQCIALWDCEQNVAYMPWTLCGVFRAHTEGKFHTRTCRRVSAVHCAGNDRTTPELTSPSITPSSFGLMTSLNDHHGSGQLQPERRCNQLWLKTPV